MSFRFQSDEDVISGVQRIAREQTARAVQALDWGGADIDDITAGVHDCRKRCKKVRGLVRIVRPALGEDRYRPANVAFRDASRALSPHRDAHALLATFDDLVSANVHQFTGVNSQPVRAELARRAEASTAALDGDSDSVNEAREELAVGCDAIDDWALDASGWEAIGPGLEKTYQRGRSALERTVDAPTIENFHQWRKRVKYSWYHLRLLRPCAPSILRPEANHFHALSDSLGDAHDLAVLHGQMENDPDAFGGASIVDGVRVIVDGRRVELERRSIAVGRRLYAEKAKHFTRRLGTYWQVWRDLGAEPPIGEMAEIFA
jgi:CHAD domain-containing protein